MKKLLVLFVFVAACSIAAGQTKEAVKAIIPGYKINDTIKVDDLLFINGITLSNKSYKIISFALAYEDAGYNVRYQAKSNLMTQEMKNGLKKLKNKNYVFTKIYFEDILVKTPQGKQIKINPLIYTLKTKQ
jgi:hypothetical protein